MMKNMGYYQHIQQINFHPEDWIVNTSKVIVYLRLQCSRAKRDVNKLFH